MFNENFSTEELPERDKEELEEENQENQKGSEEKEGAENEEQENQESKGEEKMEKEIEFAKDFVDKESEALGMNSEQNEKEAVKGVKNKLKKAIVAISLGLSLIAPVNAYAQKVNSATESLKPKSQATEMEHQEHGFSAEQENKLALQTIEELKNIPDQGVKSKAMNDYYKRIVAKTIINRFALELKLGKTGELEGKINARDVSNALKVLEQNINKFIDQEYGDKNGKVNLKEWNQFTQDMQNYPGIQELEQMILDYSTLNAK